MVSAPGTCVLDHVPRELSSEQQEALRILALQVLTQPELRRNLEVLEQNIMERKKSEEQLRHNAHHDGLTSLPNRALYGPRCTTRIKRHWFVCCAFIDLDRFAC